VNRARAHAACGREGSLGCCAREYPLGEEGFGADKETSKGAVAFVNSAGVVVLIGWYTHDQNLIQVNHGRMAPNALS